MVFPYLPEPQIARHIESWRHLPNAEAKIGNRVVPLAAFDFRLNSSTPTEIVTVPGTQTGAGRAIADSPFTQSQWITAAIRCRDHWLQRGYFTGHEVRRQAHRNLRSATLYVLDTLHSRFSEIVIDEAQNCSVADLELFDAMRRHGIPLMVVADPDQSIYGWNGADVPRLLRLRDNLAATVMLSGNRRSTPPICALAAIIRTGTRPPDVSVIRTAGPPIHLVPTKFGNIGKITHTHTGESLLDLTLRLAAVLSDPTADPTTMLLARKHTQLPPALRRGEIDTNTITRLARAHQTLHFGVADPAELVHACRQAEHRPTQSLVPRAFRKHPGDLPRNRPFARHSPPARLRTTSPPPSPDQDWAGQVNACLKTWWRPLTAHPTGSARTLGGNVTAASSSKRSDAPATLTTVHQAKGTEADAVCVLMDDTSVLRNWLSGTATTASELEERRTFYVAVTRARSLLVLALPEDMIDIIQDFLTHRHVPTKVVES